jgi:hypothetical protein
MIREKDLRGSSFTLSKFQKSFGKGISSGIHKRKSFFLRSQKKNILKGFIMAYIEKERVAEIRTELKKLFPTFKFSVTRQNYSSVNIKIMKGDIDFFDDAMRADGTNHYGDSRKLSDYAKAERHTSVNEYYIKENWMSEAQKNAFTNSRYCVQR